MKLENAAGKSKTLLEGNMNKELNSPGIDANECTNDACVRGCMCRDDMTQIQTQNMVTLKSSANICKIHRRSLPQRRGQGIVKG